MRSVLWTRQQRSAGPCSTWGRNRAGPSLASSRCLRRQSMGAHRPKSIRNHQRSSGDRAVSGGGTRGWPPDVSFSAISGLREGRSNARNKRCGFRSFKGTVQLCALLVGGVDRSVRRVAAVVLATAIRLSKTSDNRCADERSSIDDTTASDRAIGGRGNFIDAKMVAPL